MRPSKGEHISAAEHRLPDPSKKLRAAADRVEALAAELRYIARIIPANTPSNVDIVARLAAIADGLAGVAEV